MTFSIERVYPDRAPFPRNDTLPGWGSREAWPAHFVKRAEGGGGSEVAVYRLALSLDHDARARIHVTADNRYLLYVDGELAARGSERGTLRRWYYESYDLALRAGGHTLIAVAWYLEEHAPWAQVSAGAGFLLAAEAPYTELLSTGLAPYRAALLDNVDFLSPSEQMGCAIGAGPRIRVRGAPPAQRLCLDDASSGLRYLPVETGQAGNSGFVQYADPEVRALVPGRLPPMREEEVRGLRVLRADRQQRGAAFGADEARGSDHELREVADHMLLGAGVVRVMPHDRLRLLVDLGDYLCAYYRLDVRGGAGACVRVGFAERLSVSAHEALASDERTAVHERYFVGVSDEYEPDGSERAYEPFWWQAGRFALIEVETRGEAIELCAFELRRTGYPYEDKAELETTPDLDRIVRVSKNTLRQCMHETYMDCPFYEQLQYLGDTRIQALLTYATSLDSRLAEKALDVFSVSAIGASPFTASNYPSRSIQVIPPFSLLWVSMLFDYALYRGNIERVRATLPMAHWIVQNFLTDRDADGLARTPQGWNYVDSVAFPEGEPPGALPGRTSAIINWQLVHALRALEELEAWAGAPELSAFARRVAKELYRALVSRHFDEARGAFADGAEHESFSEHGQSLAILSGLLEKERFAKVGFALAHDDRLRRAGPYFTHYVCEALHRAREGHALVSRMRTWQRFVDAGFVTFPEHDIIGRSDCHAWSAHPYYHLLVHVAGIRPGSPGFGSVVIEPCLGPLEHVRASMPHPLGRIGVEIARKGKNLTATVELPAGLPGELRSGAHAIALAPGRRQVNALG